MDNLMEDRIRRVFGLHNIRAQDRDLAARARETIQHCRMVLKETPTPDTFLGRPSYEPFPMDTEQ
jgi:hypothetical protein